MKHSPNKKISESSTNELIPIICTSVFNYNGKTVNLRIGADTDGLIFQICGERGEWYMIAALSESFILSFINKN